jgi:hypothetical protein
MWNKKQQPAVLQTKSMEQRVLLVETQLCKRSMPSFTTSKSTWSKKQKRAFHRAKSGVKIAQFLHEPIKHLVLTTSPQGKDRNISTDYQVLRKRIQRKFGVLLPYFMVHTNEGYGVLHVLYRSKQYIPQKWLSSQWDQVHKSTYVYVKQPPNDVARYVVTQYVSDQGTSYQRCSWSHTWLPRGFKKAWYMYLSWFHHWQHKLNLTFMDLIEKWEHWLQLQVIKQWCLGETGLYHISWK